MILTDKKHFKVGVLNSTSTDLMKQNSLEKKSEENDELPLRPNFDEKDNKMYNSLCLSNDINESGSHYICVEKNDAFKIQVQATGKKWIPTHGAVLYLNGEVVQGKKTFGKQCWFSGFKKGNG